jgi:23S rRNA pseudouridine2605 synthase
MGHADQPIPAPDAGQASDETAGGEAGETERVAKVLARAGVASRRDVERLIAEGRVKLNGEVLTTPAVKVGPGDVLSVDGRLVAAAEAARVWRYHKPVGLVTTHKDPKNRPTVFENLPPGLPRVISVGRLDLSSEGLLLLTNDGELARALELPANALVRRYRARARGRGVTQAVLDKLRDGIVVDGIAYGPIDARLEDGHASGGANQWIMVTLAEGKNREVRKVLDHLGLEVNRLIRLNYGPFELGRLKPGEAEEVAPRIVRDRLGPLLAASAVPQGEEAPRVTPVKKAVPKVERPKVEYQPGWARPKKRVGPARPKKTGKALSKVKAAERGEASASKPPGRPPAKTPAGRAGSPKPRGPKRRG